jgi:hypothetical protein
VLQEKGIKLPFPLGKKDHVAFSLGKRGGRELFFPLRRNGLSYLSAREKGVKLP